MDYEHLVAGSARIVELAGVAVLLFGALLAAIASWRSADAGRGSARTMRAPQGR